jgi:hypothetical protein
VGIIESLIDKAFTGGGFIGLILLLMIGLVYYVIFVLNKINVAFLAAIKTSLYQEDHEFRAVKKIAYKAGVLPDRRKQKREGVDANSKS